MPYVTSAMNDETQALSFPFESRVDALLKAYDLAEQGVESVSVADLENGEVLTGPELMSAIADLARDEDGRPRE
jgi:hypothetical protein